MYTAPSNPSSTISAGMVVTLRVQLLYLGYPSGYPSGHKDLGHPRRMDKLPPGGPYSVPSSHGSPHNQKQDPWGETEAQLEGGALFSLIFTVVKKLDQSPKSMPTG